MNSKTCASDKWAEVDSIQACPSHSVIASVSNSSNVRVPTIEGKSIVLEVTLLVTAGRWLMLQGELTAPPPSLIVTRSYCAEVLVSPKKPAISFSKYVKTSDRERTSGPCVCGCQNTRLRRRSQYELRMLRRIVVCCSICKLPIELHFRAWSHARTLSRTRIEQEPSASVPKVGRGNVLHR